MRRLLRCETRKENDVSVTIGDQKTRQEAYSGKITAQICIDAIQTHKIKNPNDVTDGQRNILDTWTILQLLTYPTSPRGLNERGMTTCLFFCSMLGVIRERCQIEMNFNMQPVHLLVFGHQEGSEKPYIPRSSSWTTWWHPLEWQDSQERHQWQGQQEWHGWREWHE